MSLIYMYDHARQSCELDLHQQPWLLRMTLTFNYDAGLALYDFDLQYRDLEL